MIKCTSSRNQLLKNKIFPISEIGIYNGLREIQDGRVYFGIKYSKNPNSQKNIRTIGKKINIFLKNDFILDSCKSNGRCYDQRVFCIFFDQLKNMYKLKNCEKGDVFFKLTSQIVIWI